MCLEKFELFGMKKTLFLWQNQHDVDFRNILGKDAEYISTIKTKFFE